MSHDRAAFWLAITGLMAAALFLGQILAISVAAEARSNRLSSKGSAQASACWILMRGSVLRRWASSTKTGAFGSNGP